MKVREMLEPSSCRWCGIGKRQHFQQWNKTAGWHVWTIPHQWQIKDRMRARRKSRRAVGGDG